MGDRFFVTALVGQQPHVMVDRTETHYWIREANYAINWIRLVKATSLKNTENCLCTRTTDSRFSVGDRCLGWRCCKDLWLWRKRPLVMTELTQLAANCLSQQSALTKFQRQHYFQMPPNLAHYSSPTNYFNGILQARRVKFDGITN